LIGRLKWCAFLVRFFTSRKTGLFVLAEPMLLTIFSVGHFSPLTRPKILPQVASLLLCFIEFYVSESNSLQVFTHGKTLKQPV